jgi:redox-sensitive bicupin YhaK (pirin superfamily)
MLRQETWSFPEQAGVWESEWSHKAEPGNRETGKPGNRETGKPENRKTGKPENRETGKPGNRETGKTGKPGNRETGKPEKPGNRETGKPGNRKNRKNRETGKHNFRAAAPNCEDKTMKIRKSQERGHASLGWLDTYYTFSFAEYHDPQWMGFRSLRVINDDLVMPGMGFGAHPHHDMEIITIVLTGALEHKDSMGNGRVINAGEVQYMSAGTGVFHSEFNPSHEEAVHLLQIWIHPDRKGLAPRYSDKSFADTPQGAFHLIASPSGQDGSIAIRQDAKLWMAKLGEGDRLRHQLEAGRHAWVQVAEGKLTLNGELLVTGDGAALEGNGAWMEFAGHKASQVLLFDLN